MEGDFPPSSSVTRLSVLAAATLILIPVATLPVKEIYRVSVKRGEEEGTLLTSGCSERRRPVFPSPMTQLKTPGGKPASLKSLPRYIVERQFLSLGLTMKVFPVARAGAHFAAKSKSGTLKEVIPTHTPNGS